MNLEVLPLAITMMVGPGIMAEHQFLYSADVPGRTGHLRGFVNKKIQE